MHDTGLLASEEQKRELLPDMAALKLIGAWGLTEPSNGSDASALQTTARKVLMPIFSLSCGTSLMLQLSYPHRWQAVFETSWCDGFMLQLTFFLPR